MPTINPQVVYNFSQDTKPVKITIPGEEDPAKVASHEDMVSGFKTSEEALGQKILQDNQETFRLAKSIGESGFTALPPAAPMADVISQVNSLIDFMNTQLVSLPKDRS